LFMAGNALMFILAGIAIAKFWKGLKYRTENGNNSGFFRALFSTISEIIFHRKFFDCEANKVRSWGHLLIFYGFIGAMITAGLAVGLTVLIPVMDSPINLPNPVKILGVLSGIALIVGWIILYVRSKSGGDEVGTRNYTDRLFLNMIGWVAITGMFTYVIRGFGIPAIAYPIYFVHLVIVFFLLWYMPYSKFAHMLYRTFAVIWAKSHNRGEPR